MIVGKAFSIILSGLDAVIGFFFRITLDVGGMLSLLRVHIRGPS